MTNSIAAAPHARKRNTKSSCGASVLTLAITLASASGCELLTTKTPPPTTRPTAICQAIPPQNLTILGNDPITMPAADFGQLMAYLVALERCIQLHERGY